MFLLTCPEGFQNAVEITNTLSDAVLTELASDCLLSLIRKRAPKPQPDRFLQRHRVADIFNEGEIPADQPAHCLRMAINVVSFVFRGALADGLDASGLNKALKVYSDLSATCIQAIATVFHGKAELEQTTPSTAADTVSIGQLEDVDWRLGMAVASSQCAKLATPFVSFTMDVREPDGTLSKHSLEMTMQEFDAFAKTFTDLSEQVQTLGD